MANLPLNSPIPDQYRKTLDAFEPPMHLSHKPVFMIPYETLDGIYADETDCKYISVGQAQYDETKLSAKTFRYTERWSRLSEELPAHRVVDLVILLALAFTRSENWSQSLKIDAGTFDNQPEAIELKRLTELPPDFDKADLKHLRKRLSKLKEILEALPL